MLGWGRGGRTGERSQAEGPPTETRLHLCACARACVHCIQASPISSYHSISIFLLYAQAPSPSHMRACVRARTRTHTHTVTSRVHITSYNPLPSFTLQVYTVRSLCSPTHKQTTSQCTYVARVWGYTSTRLTMCDSAAPPPGGMHIIRGRSCQE